MTDELSPSQAAARIGATTRSVQRWIAAGRLPARRVGGRWRVASDVLDAFDRGDVASAPNPGTVARIQTVFIANRGEIARRIRRTCDAMGIIAIAPETEGPDALDLLDSGAVVAAAISAGADALHPGFGFLAESADFAEAVGRAGIRWIGPPPAAIRAMGDKAAARRLAGDLGIPTIEGYDGDDQSDEVLAAEATRIGYPILIKPSAGGGGKGMRTVRAPQALAAELAAARREARAAFGDDRLILERLLEGPRHVEVQILFDRHGHGIHLGERDCSLQRRHQKVLEETPSPAVDRETRRRLTDAALTLARAVGYESAGTCEFLLAEDGSIAFLEMNTRLQVEHPVTELVTGRDLVADQIRIAAGEPLGIRQADLRPRGHAIEVRLYAEDAEAGFLPATGQVVTLAWPSGEGIRVDAGVDVGDVVGGRFDPMLAKIVAHGSSRREALSRLRRALDETSVLGLTTNLRFLRWLVARPETVRGDARIDTIESIWHPGNGDAAVPQPSDTAWAEAARRLDAGGWRLNSASRARLIADDAAERWIAAAERAPDPPIGGGRLGDTVYLDLEGRSIAFRVAPPPDVDRAAAAAVAHSTVGGAVDLVAPMPGNVLTVHAVAGEHVDAGDAIVTIEAMKMEHVVAASQPGLLVDVSTAPGDQVRRGQLLARIEP